MKDLSICQLHSETFSYCQLSNLHLILKSTDCDSFFSFISEGADISAVCPPSSAAGVELGEEAVVYASSLYVWFPLNENRSGVS